MVHVIGKLVCKVLRRHDWDYASASCRRCRRTAEEIVAGAMTDEKLVQSAHYWRGIKDGGEAALVRMHEYMNEKYEAGLRDGYSRAIEDLESQLKGTT